MRKNKEKRDEENEYRKTLVDPDGKARFFAELAKVTNDDHKAIKKVKSKINKLVK